VGSANAGSDQALLDALRGVVDPELGDNVVDLGMVRSARVEEGRAVVELALTVASCPLRSQLKADVEAAASRLAGVEAVEVRLGEMSAEERSALMARARWKASQSPLRTEIPARARVLALASGKGGVGKSSVTVNLATALAASGLTVGLLDADIWGFSVPRLLGLQGRLEAEGNRESWSIVPLEKPVGQGRLKVVSMGLLADQEDEAIMWRGLVLSRAVQHFLEDVAWGDLDYLLVDMPPGTGDIQMGLARMLPRTEMVIVTTPAAAAERVAARAADMARKGFLRVAGVIENMSSFTCEHGTEYRLFGTGGGVRLAAQVGAPLIGSVPLDPELASGGDSGRPVALRTERPVAKVFAEMARRLVTEVAPLVEMSGCTARMLERLEDALGPAAPPAAS
jgi:ATP-binding protein involved in chromosome partitioning